MKYISSILVISLLLLSFPDPTHAATDIVNDATLSTNLVSCWTLDESSNGSAPVTRYDSQLTNTNDLTDNNTVPSEAGKISNGASTERPSAEYLSITDATQSGLDITGDISISAWLYLDQAIPLNEFYAVQGKWHGTGGAYAALIGNNGGTFQVLWQLYDNGNPTANVGFRKNTTAFTGTTWYHVVWTYVPSTNIAQMYVNGSSIGTTTGEGTVDVINNSAGEFHIGNFYLTETAYGFDGIIDEVAIWSKKVTDAEVTSLYNGGSGIPCVGTPATATTTPKFNINGDTSFGGDVVVQ